MKIEMERETKRMLAGVAHFIIGWQGDEGREKGQGNAFC
jgi:hypothetical protein